MQNGINNQFGIWVFGPEKKKLEKSRIGNKVSIASYCSCTGLLDLDPSFYKVKGPNFGYLCASLVRLYPTR